MVLILKNMDQVTIITLLLIGHNLIMIHCLPYIKFVLQEGMLKEIFLWLAFYNLCQRLLNKHFKWLKRCATVPMLMLNACFCKSKRTEIFLEYENVKCNGQHSKRKCFFSLYYKVLNDKGNQNGKGSKEQKDDSSTLFIT